MRFRIRTRMHTTRLYPLRAIAAVAACLLASPAQGAAAQSQWQDLDTVRQAAESFARANVQSLHGRSEVEVAPLDSRTRLARCESLQPFLAPGARMWGSTNVGVRCLRPGAWSVFVPVIVRVFAEVVVTARAVGRGQLLSPADLTTRSVDLTQWPIGLVVDPNDALGKATVAALPAGAPLRGDMLRSPTAVAQGQQVRVIFQGEGFQISSQGRSLSNAAVGEPVQVRMGSGKVIQGIAHSPGVVEVK